ncbi:uncharacterized protein G2W53_011252 [Senna tora]|uniref:Uncharacterized protein n=1 Tax=Senna tora TaxID=362788 RepID=A0A834X0Z8_9FABA|nr:uncharacterized protein G2W53_011252 [Senna tora]
MKKINKIEPKNKLHISLLEKSRSTKREEGFSFRRAQPLTHLSRSTGSIGESPNRFLDSSFAGPLRHYKFLQSSASDR